MRKDVKRQREAKPNCNNEEAYTARDSMLILSVVQAVTDYMLRNDNQAQYKQHNTMHILPTRTAIWSHKVNKDRFSAERKEHNNYWEEIPSTRTNSTAV